MKIDEAFEVHDTLNPKLWNTETNKLLPEVKDKLVKIVDEFVEYVDFPIDMCDVQLVGSNASYNYTTTSDLDVHIIANFDSVTDETELLNLLYNTKKADFNNNYNITIRGVEIEMYIQDVNVGVTSNGIYSLFEDDWVKFPQPIIVKKHDTSAAVQKWADRIHNVIDAKDIDGIAKTINDLYLVRHNSIAVSGEFGAGNQVFKDVRSLGLLDALKNARREATIDQLSLREMVSGKFITHYID